VIGEDERASVLQRVNALVDQGFIRSPKGGAELRLPMPIYSPTGSVHSWMVPFVADEKLLAWAQIGRGLEFLRFSLVAGGRADACPAAADWLDAAVVAARIAKAAAPRHLVSDPVLSYDRDPSRLVWVADVAKPGEPKHHWFAAGTEVWRERENQEVTGGPPTCC
jgi:hypothetical protein